MKFLIYSAQKTKDKNLLKAESEYLDRMKGQHTIEFIEYGDTKQLLAQIKNNTCIVVLDERGDGLTSTEFAQFLEGEAVRGRSQFSLIIGGPTGLDNAVKERAHRCLSLSKLTFTYQMTRLILVEQLYRASMILKGTPYHK